MKRLNLLRLFSFSLLFAAHSSTVGKEGSFHVDIRNAPVSDAIRLLAKAQGLNVIVPDKLPGKINANFPSIEMEDALAAVLDSNQLGALVEGNVVRVSSKKVIEDKGQDLRTSTFSLKYAKAEKMVPQVKQLLSSRGSVMPDERTNSITVRDTQNELNAVTAFIGRIDQADRQVLIEARIVQARAEYFQGLGVQWGATANGGLLTVNGLSGLGKLPGGRSIMSNGTIAGPTAGASLSLGPLDNLYLDAQITAAEQNGQLSILSKPSIVTMNNQPATIHSGVKFYVKTAASLTLSSGAAAASGAGGGAGAAGGAAGGSSGSGAGSVQQIDSGITLVVTPQVSANNKISLTINVTESQPDFANTVDGIPSIIDNTASTTVLLENGETTVIGGLFQKNVSDEKKGVPYLHRLPIIGSLFGAKTDKESKKELIIFLKPTVIAEGQMPAIQIESDKRSKQITDKVELKGKT